MFLHLTTLDKSCMLSLCCVGALSMMIGKQSYHHVALADLIDDGNLMRLDTAERMQENVDG